jgi:hypothetical protein
MYAASDIVCFDLFRLGFTRSGFFDHPLFGYRIRILEIQGLHEYCHYDSFFVESFLLLSNLVHKPKAGKK